MKRNPGRYGRVVCGYTSIFTSSSSPATYNRIILYNIPMNRDLNIRYKHSQTGYVTITAISAVLVLIIVLLVLQETNPVGIAVLVILVIALVLFSSLTVIIRDDVLEARFGPGLIKKTISLGDIESCHIVRHHWYNGWGIRMTSHGTLYNVSGFHAVSVRLRNGGEFNIGTDVPKELEAAINQAIK